MSFIPKGFVDHEHVLGVIGQHLFPDVDESRWLDMDESGRANFVKKCIYFLRDALYQRTITASYHDTISAAMFDSKLDEIDTGFWLTDAANRCLYSGQYNFWDGQTAQIYFRDGAIEAALQEGPDARPVKGGRPRKADAALEAYDIIYPNGHHTVGDPMKTVLAKIEAKMAEPISAGTLRNALNTRQKPNKKPV